ncbi:MAG TPA: alpha-amylase/4-alpha-glucanotransferase domain-containing protein [Gemmatimonadaceae bacterium]|nr:alpha-amylase/4-alpha-glucanotransferase domain-containing protein [Gemmatimonadaceae bacterium]
MNPATQASALPPARPPVRLVFGVHLHQPVGNFDHVFAEHARDVYRPLLDQLARRHLRPALLHISGPLLEWLEAHDAALLDQVGRLAADGAIEFLLSGMYEPILAALPRADRVEQIAWLREALHARFGVAGDGLWLSERVWEPELPFDLASAGIRYVLVDDRHFLVCGFHRDQLHVPWRTESDGMAVTVLAIDERLRYLIPFRPAREMAEYVHALHAAGRPLAVFADDGEKFGGWPGTGDWVYRRGWFDAFCDVLDALRDEGVLRLCTGREAVDAVPCGGIAYLPTASYREMEGWALPPDAAHRLNALEHQLGTERMGSSDGALVRGSHWRNFLARYAEANRMHKKTCALSALCRRRGDPAEARRAIGRAQCNDALWHGVFGGLYLPHLRAAVWRQLAIAERVLRLGEPLAAETLDLDADGAEEIWVHCADWSAVVAPAHGGALVEFTHFARGVNHADVLTRRREAYHLPSLHPRTSPAGHDGTPSIHELEGSHLLTAPPPADLDDRAIGVARVISADLSEEAYAAASYAPVASWSRARCAATVEVDSDAITVCCETPGFTVRWRFGAGGALGVRYWWDATSLPDGARFAPELSLAGPLALDAPGALEVWRYDIETVARSERGVERVRQGESVTPLFDAARGEAELSLRAAPVPATP